MSTRVNQSVYSTPKLITYGDVREITQAVGNMGTDDGGGGATSKTQP
ncbi:MAG TPA: lasso peptide [Gemmatimonadaceae bacterium]